MKCLSKENKNYFCLAPSPQPPAPRRTVKCLPLEGGTGKEPGKERAPRCVPLEE